MSESKVLELDPSTVATPADNPQCDPSKLQHLQASIAEHGQLVPGQVMRNPSAPPEWLCVGGNKRLECCRNLGGKFRAIELGSHITAADIPLFRLTDNVLRIAMTPVDQAEDIIRLMRSRKCSQLEVAKLIHQSQSVVSRTLSVKKLAPDLTHHVTNFDVVPSVAYAIASLPKHDMQREAMKKAIGPPAMSRDAVRSMVEDMKRGTGDAKKPVCVKYAKDGVKVIVEMRPDSVTEAVAGVVQEFWKQLAKHAHIEPRGLRFVIGK